GGEWCADDPAAVVDSDRLAEAVAGERAEVAHSLTARPQERVGIEGAAGGRGRVREPDHVPALVDRHRRVPGDAAEAAEVDWLAILPEHVVDRAEPAGCPVTDARAADDPAAVVDRSRGAGGVAWERRKLADLARCRAPDDGAELQNLRSDARRIVHRVLGPTDGLAPVVRAGGEAVRAPERRQRRHDAVFPAEAETLVSDRCWGREEGGAAPALTQRARLGPLGADGADAAVVLHGPEHAAVRAAERPEIGERAVPPEGG